MSVVEIHGLTKDYRQHFWTPKRRVLDDVSFNVEEGEIFGFLGPNGSGKSTTLKILLQIIYPTGGTAKLMGQPIGNAAVKKKIGFLPENAYFYEYLTAEQFLRFHGHLQGMDNLQLKRRIPEVLELVGMKGTENYYLRGYSKGMLQRVGLAQAIIHDPDLIILDEPMTGLDPVGRKEVRDLMFELRRKKKTVFFSTHILSDVEMTCDRVAILKQGKLTQCGPLQDLLSVESTYVDLVVEGLQEDLLIQLKKNLEVPSQQGDKTYFKVFRKSAETQQDFELRINHQLKLILNSGAKVITLSQKTDSLEDLFMNEMSGQESRV